MVKETEGNFKLNRGIDPEEQKQTEMIFFR